MGQASGDMKKIVFSGKTCRWDSTIKVQSVSSLFLYCSMLPAHEVCLQATYSKATALLIPKRLRPIPMPHLVILLWLCGSWCVFQDDNYPRWQYHINPRLVLLWQVLFFSFSVEKIVP